MGKVVRGVPVLLLLALPVSADELVLRNGSVFVGSVTEQGDRVVIRLDVGTMSFLKIDVREIRRTGDPLKELDRRAAAATTAPQCCDVALQARAQGFVTRSNEIYEKALLLDPDHEPARRALGYEKHGKTWLKGDDLMAARGLVKRNGRWMPAEQAERESAREAEERARNEEIKAAERQAARDYEVRMKQLALERERLEIERRRSEWGWGIRTLNLGGCGTFVIPQVQTPPWFIPPRRNPPVSGPAPCPPASSAPTSGSEKKP
jgi:hypothetical protein